MNLFFIGCSFTYGDDLIDPIRSAWPSLVAGSTRFVNAAQKGGTNERTVYQVIKNIDQFDKFYIAWTFIERFTRYRAENNFEVNFNPNLKHELYGQNNEFIEYAKLHYKFWYNDLYSFKLWLQQIVLLQSYLDRKNKKYIMINTSRNHINSWLQPRPLFNDSVKSLLCFDNMDDDQLMSEHLEIQALAKDIDQDKFLGWGTWSMADLLLQYPKGPTGHLLEEGHRAIAEYILKNDTN